MKTLLEERKIEETIKRISQNSFTVLVRKFKDRRRTTKKEQRHFGSPWISVFKKKRKKAVKENIESRE
ncbi:MAG: hypothetical protein OEW95_01700 [Candidatus Bathyarchaeota archaeon]|nr:hypothetical protein [Candidatus Bathyarchaeota archaeon]